MKKFGLILLGLCISFGAMSQAVIEFEADTHDFGKFYEQDGEVSVEFKFTNTGDAPLLITNVQAGCGCTRPTWTRTPVEPGESGVILVMYNPRGRPGAFNRAITVTTNMPEPTTRIWIRGEVIRREE